MTDHIGYSMHASIRNPTFKFWNDKNHKTLNGDSLCP